MKVAIIGGGASGLACAIEMKRRCNEIDVTVFELRDRVGKKLLVTGNGRCNMLNMNESLTSFSCGDFVSHTLKKFDVKSNLQFFSSLGLYTRSDEEGRVYPLSNQASSVLDALRFECEHLKVNIACDNEITKLERQSNGFILNSKDYFDKVVLCCGSKAGVKNYKSLELVKSLGVKTTKLTPSLTKICVKQSDFTKRVKGVRCKTNLKLYKNNQFVSQENGEILFTDYGISGIAAMQLSFYISKDILSKYKIKCDFVPELDFSSLERYIQNIIKHNHFAKCENLLSGFMPKKLGEMIIKSLGISSAKNVGELSSGEIKQLVSFIKGFSFDVSELKGFEDAQTASGGIALNEVDRKTLECKKVKGLYFAGEMLDIDALCGGYNLWWAWSSGRLCGESIAEIMIKR